VVQQLKSFGVEVYGYDPLLSRSEVEAFGVRALDGMEGKFDCVIAAVAHEQFRKMTVHDLSAYLNGRSVLIDLKGLFNEKDPGMPNVYYRRL